MKRVTDRGILQAALIVAACAFLAMKARKAYIDQHFDVLDAATIVLVLIFVAWGFLGLRKQFW